MAFTSSLSSALRVFKTLVLSVTPHARLTLASKPHDYDEILKRTIRETKFYAETLLAVLFFVENQMLISTTVACLLFCLIIYIALEAMTGDSLHKWIDEFPCGRVILACITKLPAITVLYTISAMACMQWNSVATKIVLCVYGGVILLIGLVAHLRVHVLAKDACVAFAKGVKSGFKRLFGARTNCMVDIETGSMKSDESETDGASVVKKAGSIVVHVEFV
ncbi:uncharacterized protein FOMMEDRAFT_165253 [Fomitiporia mediterranea MF3/22]|uniref:uncharacterized protein n=1 Tax=Fomitiporia mediterranea (strain MF3/22) TaxID=694068 RepID=UPI0004407435|nr:uncharacterized protein FOMMEDRAFT_165253 [Fomitiporia mediterranea MF3/22]EJD06460.1 hypothetical protein FOMMEDRAFT_165253 [Fomitiporia mediterranea MF3/22]